MNNASLELGGTNWAEKDGNILGYSVGDTSGNFSPQEFTFARGSNLSATRIDRAGLIVKGRENVLLQSNQFDTTWGLPNNSNVTQGFQGYDNSNNAWKFSSVNTTGTNQLLQITSQAGVVTNSIYAKAGSISTLKIWAGFISEFDLINGTSTHSNSKITNVGNGWYRCEVFNTFNTSNPFFTATTTGDFIYIQDAQLELGLAASPYIETTTTSAQAGVLENTPRLNYTTGVANPYLLLEPSRTNAIPYSEYFGAWDIVRATSTANASVSPDGASNAYKLESNVTGANGSWFREILSSFSGNYEFSVFAKAGTTNFLQLRVDGIGGVIFDLSDGTIKSQANAVGSVSDYGNGWYRCSIQLTASSSTTLLIIVGNENMSASVWNTTNGDSIYIFGAQLEIGSYPTSYIPTYSVSATRAADNCSKTNASGEIGQSEGTIYWNFKSDNTSLYKRFALSDGTTNNWIFIGIALATGYIRGYVKTNGAVQFSYFNSVNVSNTNVKVALGYKANDFVLYVNGSLIGVGNSGTIPLCDRIDIGSQNPTWNISSSTETYQAEVYKERLTNAELATLTTI